MSELGVWVRVRVRVLVPFFFFKISGFEIGLNFYLSKKAIEQKCRLGDRKIGFNGHFNFFYQSHKPKQQKSANQKIDFFVSFS
jgi:hypothetical protein